MKQSIIIDDDDDIAVAEILVQLLDLIPAHDNSNSKPSFSWSWGAKRRRSQPPSVAGETKSSASPPSPLMFSPSESKRKNKDELMQSFTDLTHHKDSLVKEMEAVKRHLDILRSSNLELKHRKQVIIYGFSSPALQTLHQKQQQQQQLHYPFQLQHPAIQWSSTSSVPAVNKLALPDLNLTVEEAGNVDGGYQADAMMVMDYNVNDRALASAQARKRRMRIYKEKNQNLIIRQR